MEEYKVDETILSDTNIVIKEHFKYSFSNTSMLKRLSATLNPSSSSSSPSSISPSHSSNSSLDRWSGAGVGQGQQQQQQQQHHHAAPSHYSGLSPSLNDTNASNPRVGHSSYPRPSGLSTPYSITPTTTTSNTANNEISPVSGYFGIPHSSSSSLNGGLTPSLHTTSRNVSPAQSPRLEYASMPASSSNEGISSSINNNNNNWATNTPPAPIDRQTLQKSLRCLETMLVALDEYRELSSRLAKVEKRIAKAGRDLAVSMSDGNSNNNNSGNKGRGGPTSIVSALSLTSNLFDSLSEISTKFSKHLNKEYDLINEIIGKTFKKIAKEERLQDDLLESLDLKLKKTNLNYEKKIKSTSSSVLHQQQQGGGGGGGGIIIANQIQKIHEQFNPILMSLTEEITKTKQTHNLNMSYRRELLIREMGRSLTCLSEIEFRKNCEILKKLGGLIGNVLAVQALLGPTSSSSSFHSNSSGLSGTVASGGGGKNNIEQQMPLYWPPDLVDMDEFGRVVQQTSTLQLQQQQEEKDNKAISPSHHHDEDKHNIHPLASRHPSSSSSSKSDDRTASLYADFQNQTDSRYQGRTLDDLLPPKAPFTTDILEEGGGGGASSPSSRSRSGSSARAAAADSDSPRSKTHNYDSHSSSSSSRLSVRAYSNSGSNTNSSDTIPTMLPRSASLNQLAEQELRYHFANDDFNDEYKHLSAVEKGNQNTIRGNSINTGVVSSGMRSVSFPVEYFKASSVNMDHDATVTQRNINHNNNSSSKPTINNTFFLHSSSSPEKMRRQETSSPTFRSNDNVPKKPSLQPAINYSPSQAGKIGYFDAGDDHFNAAEGRNDKGGDNDNDNDNDNGDDMKEKRYNENSRKLPSGFVMEETSPEQHLNNRNYSHHHHHSTGYQDEPKKHSSKKWQSNTDPMDDVDDDYNEKPKIVSRNLNEEYVNASRGNKEYTNISRDNNDERGIKVLKDQKQSTLSSGTQLERSSSIESTASEHSFVARMRAKYAEEKKARLEQGNQHGNQHEQSRTRNGGRRVSTIAQKWEEKTSSSSSSATSSSSLSNLSSGRPALSSLPPHHHHYQQQQQHHHRVSMPVLPTTSTSSTSSTSTSSLWSSSKVDKPDLQRHSSADPAMAVPHSTHSICEDCIDKGPYHSESSKGYSGNDEGGYDRPRPNTRRVSMPPR